jgi:hypothetical protein
VPKHRHITFGTAHPQYFHLHQFCHRYCDSSRFQHCKRIGAQFAWSLVKKEGWVNVMKLEMALLSASLVIGTDLWFRIALQGLEPALFSAAVEWSMNSVMRVREKFYPW